MQLFAMTLGGGVRTKAWRAGLFLLLTIAANGCGQTSNAQVNDGASGGGDAGAAGNDGAEPGCSFSRTLTVEAHSFPVDRFVRTNWGFVAGARSTGYQPNWLLLPESGADQREVALEFTSTEVVYAEVPLSASAAELKPIVLTAADGVGYETRLNAWPLGSGTPAARDVGAFYARGTVTVVSTASFDGSRGLVASAHPATFGPHALLLDARGNRVGDELVLEPLLINCLTALPTEHAAAFSFVDRSGTDQILRIFEFDSTGSVTEKPTLPVPSSDCPVVQIDRVGFIVGMIDNDQRFQAYALADSALPLFSEPPSLDDLGSTGQPRWLSRASDGSVLLLTRHDTDVRVAAIRQDGAITWVSGDTPFGNLIPSRPGELFNDVSDFSDIDDTIHRIDQMICTGSLSL
jgi:hypothetical protein